MFGAADTEHLTPPTGARPHDWHPPHPLHSSQHRSPHPHLCHSASPNRRAPGPRHLHRQHGHRRPPRRRLLPLRQRRLPRPHQTPPTPPLHHPLQHTPRPHLQPNRHPPRTPPHTPP